jgi:hypothetical protein
LIEFPLVVLDGRRCDVVLYRNLNGRLTFSQFNPEVKCSKRSPEEVRILSRLQCDLAAGQSVAVPELLDALRSRSVDPIAKAIDAYMAHCRNQPAELQQRAEELVRLFPGLPDGHVIQGLIHETDDPKGLKTPAAAAAAYAEALNTGLPILRPFSEALWNAVRRDPTIGLPSTGLAQRSLAELKTRVDSRVSDQLWSAWSP